MITLIYGIFTETWYLLVEMAPYLLLGLLIAGLLHVYMPRNLVNRHLSKGRITSVVKASLFGIPLPLCSCSVLPVAAHLQKKGAAKGPVLSFLISTPTTGPDSVLATYALLGPLLAIMRPIAAFINGVLTGVAAILLDRNSAGPASGHLNVTPGSDATQQVHSGVGRAREALNYAFVDLVGDIAKWLLIGIVAGGLISYLLPAEAVSGFAENPMLAYLAVFLVGLPMYVCATGSIPIAAALMMKGLSPGAAFVFLFAGPATNTAAISFVSNEMGRRTTFLYIVSILVCSMVFGVVIDQLWTWAGTPSIPIMEHDGGLPYWLKIACAAMLSALLVRALWPRRERQSISNRAFTLLVTGMSCGNCRKRVEDAVMAVEGVVDVDCNPDSGKLMVAGNPREERVIEAIEAAGYGVANGKMARLSGTTPE